MIEMQTCEGNSWKAYEASPRAMGFLDQEI